MTVALSRVGAVHGWLHENPPSEWVPAWHDSPAALTGIHNGPRLAARLVRGHHQILVISAKKRLVTAPATVKPPSMISPTRGPEVAPRSLWWTRPTDAPIPVQPAEDLPWLGTSAGEYGAALGKPSAKEGARWLLRPRRFVLVHGAWADATGFDAEIRALQRLPFCAIGFANPLRDLAGESAYMAEFLRSLTGPVVLVGHSYGGNVISGAAAGNDQVQALVYFNGWMCDALGPRPLFVLCSYMLRAPRTGWAAVDLFLISICADLTLGLRLGAR